MEDLHENHVTKNILIIKYICIIYKLKVLLVLIFTNHPIQYILHMLQSKC